MRTLGSLVERALQTLALLVEGVIATLDLQVKVKIEYVISSSLFPVLLLGIEDPLKMATFYINIQLCIGLIIAYMLLLVQFGLICLKFNKIP